MTLEERLEKIEVMLAVLIEGQQAREWYRVDEVARLTGRSSFTVREWARKGRILATKKGSGQGAHAEWAISHEELTRLQKEGLLPQQLPPSAEQQPLTLASIDDAGEGDR